MFPSLESLVNVRDPFTEGPSASNYEAIASSQDPLQSLVRSQIDKEEEAYRRKLRQIVLGNASQNPQDLINQRLQEYENQTPGRKASNFLTELFSAIGKGANYIPYRDIVRERALQEYKLNQANVNATVGVLRAEAQAQAAEERARQAETKMQLDQQYRLLQEQRKSLADETKKKDTDSKIADRDNKWLEMVRKGDIMQQYAKLGERKVAVSEANSLEAKTDILANSEEFKKDFGEPTPATKLIARRLIAESQVVSKEGGGDKTVTSSSSGVRYVPGQDENGNPTLLQLPNPTTRTTTIKGGGGQSLFKRFIEKLSPKTQGAVDSLTGDLNSVTPSVGESLQPQAQTKKNPTLLENITNKLTPSVSSSSSGNKTLSNNKSITIIDPATGLPVRSKDSQWAAGRRMQSDMFSSADAMVDQTMNAIADGSIKKIIGIPGIGDALQGNFGALESIIRPYIGKNVPRARDIFGFWRQTRAEELFSKGGKNLTANEMRQVENVWPDVFHKPENFAEDAMRIYYMLAFKRWRQDNGITPDKAPLGLYLEASNKDIANKIGAIQSGKMSPKDINPWELFNTVKQSVNEVKNSSSSSATPDPSITTDKRNKKSKERKIYTTGGGVQFERIED